MGQELVLPDWAKNRQVAQAFATLNTQDDNLSDGIGQSYGVIGYKGGKWTLRYRGQKHLFARLPPDPDAGQALGYIDIIILGQAKTKSKSYYPDWKEGSEDRPVCASMDGVVPDLDVVQKQCDSCVLCPRNVWKTDPQTGRKGRECTDYKRLAVLILPNLTKPLLGVPLLEPVFLRVPPASLNSLSIMGDTMTAQGFHYSSYVTRITFDPQQSHPQMVFRPLQGLTDAEAPVILEMRSNPQVGRITGGEIAMQGLKAVQQALAAPGTVPTGLGAALSPAHTQSHQGPTSPSPAESFATAAPSSAPSIGSNGQPQNAQTIVLPGNMQGARPVTPAPQPSVAPTGMVDTGFGGVSGALAAPVTQAVTQAVTQTVVDAGPPEESDAAMDARIASLIKG